MSTFALKTSGTEKDVALADPPTDSISALAWSPAADFLAAASWSNEVRVYEVGDKGANKGVAMFKHEAPVLDVCWSKDGGKIVSGGADNAVRLYDAATAQSTQIGVHDAPVKCVRWVDAAGGLVCSGSWDKTLRYWDLRQPAPVAQVSLPERCYAMDCVFPLLVAATAGQHVLIFNLNNPTVPFKTVTSPLKQQTRTLSCYPDGSCYALASTEGRVGIQYVDEARASTNFSFKCHRRDLPKSAAGALGAQWKTTSQAVYAVNELAFNNLGTIWDHLSKTRLKTLEPDLGPITAAKFSRTSQYLACAPHAGYMGNTPQQQTKIMLHACEPEEVKPKPKKT
ncbi:RNA export factor gle2 [Rhodotorula kratochvilovae]